MNTNQHSPKTKQFRILSALLFLVIGLFAVPVRGAENLTISLIGLEAGFPEIRANVRILGSDNRVVEEINPADIEIYENGTRINEFEVVPAQTSPQLIAILVDSGINTTYERDYGDASIRAAFGGLISERIIDSQEDKVILTEQIADGGIDQTILHVTAADNPADVMQGFESISFTPANEPTEAFIGIDETLTEISTSLEGQAGTPSSLIFFYHNVNWPPQTQQVRLARAMADKALAQGTRIYVIHANPRNDFSEPFEEMAQLSGGKYINLAADDVLTERFAEIYEDLEPQSQTYVLRFNSNSINPGEREIAIVPAGEPVSKSQAVGSVNLSSNPVSILVESNPDIVRTPAQVGDEIRFTPSSTPILAQVESWPYILGDDDLTLAELIVNGVPVQTIENPEPTNIVFDLNINQIEIDSTLLVQVRLSDKNDLVFKSETQQLLIEVEEFEPTAVPTEPPAAGSGTAAGSESSEPVPTPTPFVVVSSESADQSPSFLSWLPWALTALLLLALIGVIIFFNRRLNQLGAGVAREAYRRGGLLLLTRTIITGPIRGNEVIARLKVLKGPEGLVGNKVDIYTHNVNIGRDPRRCDIVLYDGDDLSSVSSLHVIIQFDQGAFKITDASTNGTKLNGKQLESDLPADLKNGDTIILGDLFKRGAELKFEVPRNTKNKKNAKSEKQQASLSKLNAIDKNANEELIEVIEQAEPEQPKAGQTPAASSKSQDDNDENWMDELE